jgi:hypothetical protein
MTALDTLARQASDAIHESVAQVPVPVAPGAVAAGTAGMWGMAKYALAGAAAGVAVLAVLIFAPPQDEETPADTTVPTTVTTTTIVESPPTTVAQTPTTVPSPEAPVPIGAGEDPTPTSLPPVEEDLEPPGLVVTSPVNGEHLTTSIATFTGTTEPGASLMASGKFPVVVGEDGAWTIDLVLAPGANGVVFLAADDAGNESEVRMTVYYDAEEKPKDTTTTTKATWEFSATQKYGTCSEPVPYDEFSGKAKPGSTVTVTSSHGSGSTTADGDGNWWIRVEFPSAPYNTTFSVKAKDQFGNHQYFEFVSLYSG